MQKLYYQSSSASIDLYVSSLISLLTILRLYAILRALTYYRRLRRFNDLEKNNFDYLINYNLINNHTLANLIGAQDFLFPFNNVQLNYGYKEQEQQAPVVNMSTQVDRLTNTEQLNKHSTQATSDGQIYRMSNAQSSYSINKQKDLVFVRPNNEQESGIIEHDYVSQLMMVPGKADQRGKPARQRAHHLRLGPEIYSKVSSSSGHDDIKREGANLTSTTTIKVLARDEFESEPVSNTKRLSGHRHRLDRRLDRLEALRESRSDDTESKSSSSIDNDNDNDNNQLNDDNRKIKLSQQENSALNLGITNTRIEYFNSSNNNNNISNFKQPTVFALMHLNSNGASKCSNVEAKRYKLVAKYRPLESIESTTTTTTARAIDETTNSISTEDSDQSDQQQQQQQSSSIKNNKSSIGMKGSEEFVSDLIEKDDDDKIEKRIYSQDEINYHNRNDNNNSMEKCKLMID